MNAADTRAVRHSPGRPRFRPRWCSGAWTHSPGPAEASVWSTFDPGFCFPLAPMALTVGRVDLARRSTVGAAWPGRWSGAIHTSPRGEPVSTPSPTAENTRVTPAESVAEVESTPAKGPPDSQPGQAPGGG